MATEKIEDLGEFGLIERIKKDTKIKHDSTVQGIGDDCSIINTGDDCLVTTTDALIEAIHFDLRYAPLMHLGYKSVAINVSDIAAMNATPTHIMVSIGIPPRFTLEAIDELYKGIHKACEAYNVDLIGGDTNASPSGLMISVTAYGKEKKENISMRSGAKKGDIVCVTGDLGAAFIGLNILEREKEAFLNEEEAKTQLEAHAYAVGRQLKPEARMDVIYDLKDAKVVPTSMIDISDGLASEIMHICTQSDVGMQIYEDKLPIMGEVYNAAVDTFRIDPITCMMNGGEDYELLFTIKQEDHDKLKNHPDICLVGFVTEKDKGVNLVTKAETVVPITAQGWNHLKK